MRAKHIATGKEYAVKILDKNHLIRHNKQSMALAEKNALVKLGSRHPGVIRLYWTFQDEFSLCKGLSQHSSQHSPCVNLGVCVDFVVDLARNGEMQSLVSRLGSLSINCAQYYAAQIVDAVEYMHSLNVIHRFE
jgi:3-phosphoinositide dependent protein kinase-1